MERVRAQFETNVFGLVELTRLVLPGMRRRRAGRIVNLSSMGGRLVFPGGAFYHATKHAVEALSDALRFEARGYGIDVVVIEPGLIRSGFGDAAAASIETRPEVATVYDAFNAAVAKATRESYERGPPPASPARPTTSRGRSRGAHGPQAQGADQGHPSARLLLAQRRWSSDRAWDWFLRRSFPSPGARRHDYAALCLQDGGSFLMCRSIRPLHNYDPPTTAAEVDEAALQFVRKISGMRQPARDEPGGVRPRCRRPSPRLRAACLTSSSLTARRAAGRGRSRGPASAPPCASPPRRPDGWSCAASAEAGSPSRLVGMGTWQTFDVRGDEAERNVRGWSTQPSPRGRRSSTARPCTARPNACSARPSTGGGTTSSSRRRCGRTTTPRPTSRCERALGWLRRARRPVPGAQPRGVAEAAGDARAPARRGEGGRDRRHPLAGEPLRRPRSGHATVAASARSRCPTTPSSARSRSASCRSRTSSGSAWCSCGPLAKGELLARQSVARRAAAPRAVRRRDLAPGAAQVDPERPPLPRRHPGDLAA